MIPGGRPNAAQSHWIPHIQSYHNYLFGKCDFDHTIFISAKTCVYICTYWLSDHVRSNLPIAFEVWWSDCPNTNSPHKELDTYIFSSTAVSEDAYHYENDNSAEYCTSSDDAGSVTGCSGWLPDGIRVSTGNLPTLLFFASANHNEIVVPVQRVSGARRLL